MNKTVAGAILAVLALGAIAAAVVLNKPQSSTSNTTTTSASTADMSNPKTNSESHGSVAETQSTNKVEIVDTDGSFAFSPKKIQVKKGTTVTWTNKSDTRHDVTPDQPTAEFKASELLKKGETYQVTFTDIGTYTYFCSPHPYMKASVEVVE